MSLDDLFYVVEEQDLVTISSDSRFVSTWSPSCATGQGCSDSKIEALQNALIANIQAKAGTSSLQEAFRTIWNMQYNLSAIRVVVAFFDTQHNNWSSTRKSVIVDWLINHGCPFFCWDLFVKHLDTLDSSDDDTSLDLPSVFAAFTHRHPAFVSDTETTSAQEDLAEKEAQITKLTEQLEAKKTELDDLRDELTLTSKTKPTPPPDSSNVAACRLALARAEALEQAKSRLAQPLSDVAQAKLALAEAEARELAKPHPPLSAIDKLRAALAQAEADELAMPSPLTSSSKRPYDELASSIIGAADGWPDSGTFVESSDKGPPSALEKHLITLTSKLMKRIFFHPAEFAKSRLDRITCLRATPRKKVALGDGLSLSVDHSADDVEVPNSFHAFEDGFLFVLTKMLELPSRAAEVPDRVEWLRSVKDMFGPAHAQLLGFAQEFGIKYQKSREWAPLAQSDAALLIKWLNRKTVAEAGVSRVSGANRGRVVTKGNGQIRKSSLPPGSTPTVDHPMGVCKSRISKMHDCTRSYCKFSHVCIYCKADHPASKCSKAP
jgi:hypothetical protein